MYALHLFVLVLASAATFAAPNKESSPENISQTRNDFSETKAQCPQPLIIAPCTCQTIGSDVYIDCSQVGGTPQLNAIFSSAIFPLNSMNQFKIVGNKDITSLDDDFLNGLSFRVSHEC